MSISGLGARVTVVTPSGLTQHFDINTGIGYLSASDKRLLVGLGRETSARRVEILWPSGAVQTFEDVRAGQMLTVTEPPAGSVPAPDAATGRLR